MSLVTIKVTKELIEAGCRRPGDVEKESLSHPRCATCPVAVAMNKVLVAHARAWVGPHRIAVNSSSSLSPRVMVDAPRHVTEAIRMMDQVNGPRPEPFEFQIDIPDYLLKQREGVCLSSRSA